MEKTMSLAVAIVLLVALAGGLSGVLWCFVFAIPIGIALAVVGAAMGWFDE
jgi:hypothetical protein